MRKNVLISAENIAILRQTPLTCLSLTISCRSDGNAAHSASISLQSRGATGGQVSSGAWLVATPRISGRWNTLSWREHSAFSFRTESDPQSARMFSQPISMSIRHQHINTNFAVVKCHHQYIYETAIRCYLAASYVIVLLLISISVLIYLSLCTY